MHTFKKIALILTIGALCSQAQAGKHNNCDSTCDSQAKKSTFSSLAGSSAIDAMAESGSGFKYKSCSAGFLTSGGQSSYAYEKTPIFGFYSKGVLIYNKNGSPVKIAEESCYKTETRTIACDAGFTGSRLQSSTATQSPSGLVTYEPWKTYNSSCYMVEKTTEQCPQGYTGSIEKQRTISESSSGAKTYGSWVESLNNCKKAPTLPDTGLATDTINGFEISPVLRIDTYNGGQTRNLVLRDNKYTYYGIYGDNASDGVIIPTKEQYEAYTCKYTNWCQDSYGAYLYTPKKSFYLGGVEVAYWYGDMFLFYNVSMVFPLMDRFSGRYNSGDFDYSNPNLSSIYYCPVGFGVAPSRTHCSKEFKGGGGFSISPIF